MDAIEQSNGSSKALAVMPNAAAIEAVLVGGDLAKLSAPERVSYYKQVCESLGLNPLTRPFEYINLNGKLTFYARKDCAEQLRKLHKISTKITDKQLSAEGVYTVTVRATMPDGREDESIGALFLKGKSGEDLANAYMKTETKAKRRATLSICGLGFLDESEIDSIPGAQPLTPQQVAEIDAVSVEDLEERIHEFEARIDGCASRADLKLVGSDIEKDPASATIKEKLRTQYNTKHAALKGVA